MRQETGWDESVVLDATHLRGFTGGDTDLEAQVLQIFQESAPTYLVALEAADASAWQGSAHKLKGAARGIGAWRLAVAAERAEHDEKAAGNSQCAAQHFEVLHERLQQLSDAIAVRLKEIRDAEMIDQY
ncbi:Hpt domain-containing protein [Kordiimonas gwangyangensis]|uniref:Hpt domain-containing protein n=1 Tax=Kordiimonas gwangyangensis TaxID=288022 RepID=UPI00035EF4A8|nr:Hpt domain-containing protein [Kordiimonas gwangyangensis]